MAMSILYPNKRFFPFFFENFLTPKSLLNLHFNGFGAISPLRGCRSCFSVHFGIGDVQKAPTGSRFKPILTFFLILAMTTGCLLGKSDPTKFFFGNGLMATKNSPKNCPPKFRPKFCPKILTKILAKILANFFGPFFGAI